jgi:NitT/TauT family transport system substrate-binding protein
MTEFYLTRRSLLRSTGLLGLAVLSSNFPGARSIAADEKLTEFNMGVSALVPTILPVWMIPAGGFDKKNGLKLNIVDTNGGSRGIQVLLSGHLQATHVGLGAVVLANAHGADLRVIACSTNVDPMELFSLHKVKTAADLTGGTVAISSFGSESEIAANLGLDSLGLPKKQVQLIQLGGDAHRLAALMAGQVQAAILMEPAATKAREAGFNTLVNLQAAKLPYTFDCVVATADYIKSRRGVLLNFLRAYIEGAHLALSNKKIADQVIRTSFKIPDPRAIENTYTLFEKIMPPDARPTEASAKGVIEQLQKIGIKIEDTNPKDYLDLSLLDDLQKDGFFKRLK